MKNVQKELIAISTTLSSLVKKVEKMAVALEKGSGKAAPAKKVKAAKKAKAPAKKAKAAPKKTTAKKTASAGAKPSGAKGAPTMLESILGMISRSRKGITVEQLKKKSGFHARQVSNALYKLTQKGQIATLARGVYVKKKS